MRIISYFLVDKEHYHTNIRLTYFFNVDALKMDTKLDFYEWCENNRGVYNKFMYDNDMVKPKILIESEFYVDDLEFHENFPTYHLTFLPNEELTNLGEKLEEAIKRVAKCDKSARSGLCNCAKEVCFAVEFVEGDGAIVIDVNGKVIPFKSLFKKDSYGRCKLSIEGFFERDDHMEAHVIVKQIILL